MRLQEFYESPYEDIRGQYVSYEKVIDRYAKDTGEFSYFTDWSGFNVPSSAFKDFFKWTHAPSIFPYLSKEYNLWNLVRGKLFEDGLDIDDNFYLIATYIDGDILHEVAHGLYFLDDNYKKDMNILIEGYKDRKNFSASLLDMCYCKDLVDDEIQAYLSTSDTVSLRTYIPSAKKCSIPDEFGETLEKYLKKYKVKYNGNLLKI